MRTVLICHHDAPIVRQGMAAWLNSCSSLCGIVILKESRERRWTRVRREIKRNGLLRFLDIAAFRLHYRIHYASTDAAWTKEQLLDLEERYGQLPSDIPTVTSESPNSAAVQEFIAEADPDITIAACKRILTPRIFNIAHHGTFVLHPGICPDYRNAHGGFWALAKSDPDNVGMSLVKIDKGIDTGPVYGHFRQPYDARTESHLRIQRRQTLGSLDAVAETLRGVVRGTARPLNVAGRPSAEFGQPWLSAYYRWKLGRSAVAMRETSQVATNWTSSLPALPV